MWDYYIQVNTGRHRELLCSETIKRKQKNKKYDTDISVNEAIKDNKKRKSNTHDKSNKYDTTVMSNNDYSENNVFKNCANDFSSDHDTDNHKNDIKDNVMITLMIIKRQVDIPIN